jgi:hypothetical protein
LPNKSVIQFNEKDFVGSEKSALHLIQILKKTNHDELTYEVNNILELSIFELSEFNKASSHNAALILKQNIPLEYQAKETSLNNIGAKLIKKINVY